MPQMKKNTANSSSSTLSIKKENGGGTVSHPIPARLSYAEDALRTMSLPEGLENSSLHNYFQFKLATQLP